MQRLRWLVLLGALLLMAAAVAAQEQTPIPIATNTPRAPLGVLATNTPPPPTATPRTPGGFDSYALRLWTPADIVLLAEDMLRQLNENPTPDTELIVRLALYELETRFPAVLAREGVQERLLSPALSAPRGTVDMRPIVRPYIARLVSENRDLFDEERAVTYSVGEFTVGVQPINATPLSDTDVLLTITSQEPDGSPPRYQDVVVGRFSVDGLAILPAAPDYPAAPFNANAIEAVELLRVGDLNNDGADEFAAAVTRTDIPDRAMVIYAVRGDTAFGLAAPGTTIRFSGAPQWGDAAFTVTQLQAQPESFWGCAAQQPVTWTWGANVFFPDEGASSVRASDLACQLDALGNVFALPPGDAIAEIEALFAAADAVNADLQARADLILAMLYLLNAQPEPAAILAGQVAASADAPRAEQARAVLRGIGSSNVTPLEICGAIELLPPDVVCDVAAVTARLLAEPFSADTDILVQLAGRGIPAERLETLQTIGRRDRLGAYVPLGEGGIWIAFNETDNGYTAEIIETPPRFVTPEATPPSPATLTRNLAALLFRENDRTGVVTAIDSLDVALAPDVRFIRAFANDLAGNRDIARRQYYDLWAADPDGVWGQFAARHLERR